MAFKKEIKIVTINTWKCDGDYRPRLQVLAKQLTQLNPDIIACQECFVCETADTLRFLAERLNMAYAYLRSREKKRYFEGAFVDSGSGLGILSKYSITGANWIELPVVLADNDRKIQQAEIMIAENVRIFITNTHLTHLRDEPLRTLQAETLAQFVLNEANSYHIVCGDFNCGVSSREISAFTSASKSIDCYSAGKGKEPRYSLWAPYMADKQICVDHIFSLSLPGEDHYPQFINSAIVLNEPDALSGLFPSDHFGVTTTLIINKQ